MMLNPGDALLYAVSSRRSMPWNSFKAAIDATFLPGNQPAIEIKYLRSGTAGVGDSLGHWDITPYGDTIRICVAPPVLARLPWPGLPRAVLCGSRSPDTVPDAVAACGRSGKAAVHSVAAFHPYAPSRVEVLASADDGLAVLAADLGIRYAGEAPAWGLAMACCSITEYLASLEWEPDDGLDWPRHDFDPGRLALGRELPGESDETLRLSTYEHPKGWTRFDRLRRDGQVAKTDRAWGRYAVLASAGIPALHYDYRAGTVTVPRRLPLPKLAARS
ncbi:MAG: hypothetical protein ACRDHY_01120, partial [Anaerolineales bacterium]